MSELYNLFAEQLQNYDLGLLSKEKREQRILTCQACDNFNLTNTQCNICGCNVNYLVMFGPNSCKVGKWAGEPEPSEVEQKNA